MCTSRDSNDTTRSTIQLELDSILYICTYNMYVATWLHLVLYSRTRNITTSTFSKYSNSLPPASCLLPPGCLLEAQLVKCSAPTPSLHARPLAHPPKSGWPHRWSYDLYIPNILVFRNQILRYEFAVGTFYFALSRV